MTEWLSTNGITPVSALIDAHAMTLRDGAMVCKAGDWPDDSTPMPDPDEGELFSEESLNYALDHVLGHKEHLAAVVDREVADLVRRERAAGFDDGVDASFRGMVMRQNANDVKRTNPYRKEADRG